jgi:hypothetical protein
MRGGEVHKGERKDLEEDGLNARGNQMASEIKSQWQ